VKLSVVGFVLVGLVACGEKPKETKAPPPPREVEVLEVRPTDVRETGEYLGSLISRQSVNVLPQVAGYVRKILVKPGDKVEAGTPLIEVDARQEFAALESAEAQGRAAGSNLELARQTLTRTKQLYQEGIVSAQELERAQAAVETADASSGSANAQISQRKVQLQYFAVKAPFAGTLGDVRVRIGDFVNASTVLTSVAQADALEIGVSIPAERARDVSVGTAIEILGSKGEVLLNTNAYFVAPEADPRSQLVEVKAAFRNTVNLRPSELVRARLVFGTRKALQVPALSVVRQSGQPFVFLVSEKDGKTVVLRKPVKLGSLGAQNYVVESGLNEGDKIAVSSLQALRDGAAIVAKPAGSTSEKTAGKRS
jgi:RND family efflux transporter MFP subunit